MITIFNVVLDGEKDTVDLQGNITPQNIDTVITAFSELLYRLTSAKQLHVRQMHQAAVEQENLAQQTEDVQETKPQQDA